MSTSPPFLFVYNQDAAVRTKLEAFADGLEDVPMAITGSDEIFTEYGVTVPNRLSLFKKFDEGRVDMQDFGPETPNEAIRAFVDGNQLPLVVKFTAEVCCFTF